MVFEVIFHDHYLFDTPLVERKEILKQILPVNEKVIFVDYIFDQGLDLFEMAKQNNLEGVVAKRANTLYLSFSRSKEWLKFLNKTTYKKDGWKRMDMEHGK